MDTVYEGTRIYWLLGFIRFKRRIRGLRVEVLAEPRHDQVYVDGKRRQWYARGNAPEAGCYVGELRRC